MLRKHKVFLVCVLLVIAFASVSASAQHIKLTLWGGYPEMAPFYKQVIEDHQKENPNVEISFLTHPLREHEQKLSATIPSNTAAEISSRPRHTQCQV